ncbi:hypothetical protein ISF_09884 [Cordyceps fumosorosea ARSEF 2679]|uniref:Geranylgeranyl pyrophosphate synthetase n=1 Tax=Cordyceps fumosorosea (strain ARSEF 2679) TaxID=1081104 RepID=A0A167A8F1_CORFA|nr:hypothetical protein ISF_09884 [Cordyceps fumosorosea ARSEF 2679]OAA38652.1 hypothetical protein ISF_09884 [Cordyceps fumosorosea ARSEF 2679]
MNHKNLSRFPRGRGASSRGSRGGKVGRATAAELVPPAPLGLVVGQFLASDLPRTVSAGKTLGITDVETIASFNWLDKADAHITVPGMPPKWTPLDQPRKLEQDSGTYYRDKNAAHYPDFPLEASVEAIMKMSSDADKASYSCPVDVFGCASTLGNLLRFTRGESASFRILVEVVDTTVHFIRREKSSREIIQDVLGYGHTFPETYTTWDKSVRGSTSHQRILKYHFGGLTLPVRFEGDGYFPDHVSASSSKDANSKKAVAAVSVDDLIASLSVSLKVPSSKISLTISDGGRTVPPRATFDLKTRSVRRKAEEAKIIAGEMPRLWLRQTPTLILAYHEQGVFRDINVQDVRAGVGKWQDENQEILARFLGLLERIVGLARDQTVSKLEITCDEGSDTLYVREQIAVIMSAFSPPVEDRWKSWLANHGTRVNGKDNENAGQLEHGSGDELDRIGLDYTVMMSVATVAAVHIERLRKNWVLQIFAGWTLINLIVMD